MTLFISEGFIPRLGGDMSACPRRPYGCLTKHELMEKIDWQKLEIDTCEKTNNRLQKEIDELKKKGDAESKHMIRSNKDDIEMYYTDIELAKKQMIEPKEKLASHYCH